MKVLLIDANPSVTMLMIINLARNGFEAPAVRSVERAEEIAGITKVDLVALASPGLASSKGDIARLHKAFGCPVLVYGPDAGDDGDGADKHMTRYYEPADFIKAVQEAIAGKP